MPVILTFGPLEKEILEIIWKQNTPCSVRDVFCTLQSRRCIAYTTVMTVLNRLVEKGVLQRCRDGKAHTYTSLMSQQDVLCLTIKAFFATLKESKSDGYLALSREFDQLPQQEQLSILKALVPQKG